MCWSPDADLIAGGVIAALGVGALAGVRRRTDLPLAALPLLLGTHQMVESVVWRGQEGTVSPSVASSARVVWAVIALPLLPLLVPVAVLLASSSAAATVRRQLVFLTGLGTATSITLAFALARGPVKAHVHGHTLAYTVGIPAAPLVVAGYLVATLGALLVAEDRTIRTLGVVCTIGSVACFLIWRLAFASTWCALAAVASLILLRWAWRSRPMTRPSGLDGMRLQD
ncbi:DUF6629 family protein [Catenulispora pinisilvae]|uniref:DUF6629 family protein n=1 Tax=Catenulispora pinisilvae TaxID=2705253 RepID=UPI0018912541|nr:DUF6629 family protein [Catenulispora pinisilvae]